MVQEQENRDADIQGVRCYNDWNGWGATEVLENMLADFNKVIFKKDIAPLKKWAHVEGLVTWLKLAYLAHLMMNENGPGIAEVFSMFIPMHIAAIEMLSEHNLINETPSPRAFNASIVTVLLIDFLKDTANDFDIEDVCEIVRAVDKAGLKLVPRKEVVGCNSEDIELLRAAYKEKEDEYEGEAYPERDWKEEYTKFKKNHAGGRHYDLTKKGSKGEYTRMQSSDEE